MHVNIGSNLLLVQKTDNSDLGHVGIWVAGYGMVFGIISPTTARSATMMYQNVGISNGHCLGTILIFQRLIT